MRKWITVFTPTYNRAYRLYNLYESLCHQTNKNFEWMIIDDGSTDDTRNIVEKWKNEGKLHIKYKYQDNQGKHVAFNNGVRDCYNELFFCVDSDDYLTEDSIQVVFENWMEYQNKDEIAGMVAYRGYDGNTIIGSEFNLDVKEDTLSNIYKKGKTGDTALIFRTDVLKEFPFPVFSGEKFIRESIVYNRIDEQYKLIIVPKIIYIGEYLDDGLSQNAFVHDELSPNGAAIYRLIMFKSTSKLREKIGYGMAYAYFCDKAGKRKAITDNIGKFWGGISLILLGFEKYRRKTRMKHVI